MMLAHEVEEAQPQVAAEVCGSGLVVIRQDGRLIGSWRPTRRGLVPYAAGTPEWTREAAEQAWRRS